jgi:hypothetical protein
MCVRQLRLICAEGFMSIEKSTVFLFDSASEALTSLSETGYDLESHLQDLLSKFPELLAGDPTLSTQRYLLIAQEMPVPDSNESGGRWSLDHLFIDQDAIPTFVECKRSSDPRGRREVVTQMLDYVANGVAYWKRDELRMRFERTCATRQIDAEVLLKKHLSFSLDDGFGASTADGFWENAERNLRERRVRLIFVADKIPNELKRLVEFLNEEMTKVEVLAMNIRQFKIEGDARSVLVPEIVGATARAENVKDRPRKALLDAQTFLERVAQRLPALASFYVDLWKEFEAFGGHIKFTSAGATLQLPTADPQRDVTIGLCYDSYFQYYFDRLLNQQELREELRDSLVSTSSGSFQKKGQHTATVDGKQVSEENGKKLIQVYLAVCQRLKPILATWNFET